MTDPFQPTPGQAALVESEPPSGAGLEGAAPVTGIVDRRTDGVLRVSGVASADLVDGSAVLISIFAPDALWRVRGTARWESPGTLVIFPVHDEERIQRRRWPRHEVHLDVTLACLDGDEATGVTGRTIDLGMGGLRVETRRRLPPGADVTVFLALPDASSLVERAAVVSSHVTAGRYLYGLAFDRLAEVDAGRLRSLLDAQTAVSSPVRSH